MDDFCRLVDVLLPARMGMDPRSVGAASTSPTAPRARGDGPTYKEGHYGLFTAPRARGDGPRMTSHVAASMTCSPRPRGWPPRCAGARHPCRLLPARTGMAPWRRRGARRSCGSASHSRGDGPEWCAAMYALHTCSPLTRGWPYVDQVVLRAALLLPARVGMAPSRPSSAPARSPEAVVRHHHSRHLDRRVLWSSRHPCVTPDGAWHLTTEPRAARNLRNATPGVARAASVLFCSGRNR